MTIAAMHSNLRPSRRPRSTRWYVLTGAKIALAVGFCAIALATPGFLSVTSLVATLDLASLVGMVALGMVFVTISGNILSLALAISMATCAIAFIGLVPLGVPIALVLSIALGMAINALQGLIIGLFRANPIIVSIATLGLVTGVITALTSGGGVMLPPEARLGFLRGRIGPIEAPTLIFLCLAVVAQIILSFTRFGRELFLVGSNSRAAEAAGIRVARVIGGAYAVAGAFAAIAGIVAAARFESASLEMAHTYDYDSIASVLIGGTLISGGHGSAWQTVLGTLVYAGMTTLLALGGYSQETQRLLTGALILAVICLHAAEERK